MPLCILFLHVSKEHYTAMVKSEFYVNTENLLNRIGTKCLIVIQESTALPEKGTHMCVHKQRNNIFQILSNWNNNINTIQCELCACEQIFILFVIISFTSMFTRSIAFSFSFFLFCFCMSTAIVIRCSSVLVTMSLLVFVQTKVFCCCFSVKNISIPSR